MSRVGHAVGRKRQRQAKRQVRQLVVVNEGVNPSFRDEELQGRAGTRPDSKRLHTLHRRRAGMRAIEHRADDVCGRRPWPHVDEVQSTSKVLSCGPAHVSVQPTATDSNVARSRTRNPSFSVTTTSSLPRRLMIRMVVSMVVPIISASSCRDSTIGMN